MSDFGNRMIVSPGHLCSLDSVRVFVLMLLCLAAGGCGGKERAATPRSKLMETPAYWVWHRSGDLKPAEIENLRQAETKKLCWQAVECGWKSGKWDAVRIAAPMAEIDGVEITPVFRIRPEPAFLGSPDAVESFARIFRNWADGGKISGLQLDFDCPARLLGPYGKFLRELGRRLAPVKVSITALASWPGNPEFDQLAHSVSAMAPMFYDLQSDKPEDVLKGRFRPMADLKTIELIRGWSGCPVPWLAGLPNFERISVFNPDGSLSGHLRGWTHDDLFFNEGTKPVAHGDGITTYETGAAISLAGTPVKAGSMIVYRRPEAAALEKLSQAAADAGAAGVIYFALPGPGIQAAFSATHLAGKSSPQPEVIIRENGSVVLTNRGPADLSANPEDGAWTLVLESETAGAFRSGGSGKFARVTVVGELPAELATRVGLHFSKLSAGESISSGPMVVHPKQVLWSVPGITAKPEAAAAE